MDNPPSVTFIICTYNRADYLDDTLSSLLHQDSGESNFELLIVDNNSSDQTPATVQKYQRLTANNASGIRYVKEIKQGLSHARNRGIKEARAASIVFLDDDIRATPALIPAWISFFADNANAVAAGGKIHVQFDDPRPDWMSHFLLPLLGRHDLGDSRAAYPKNKYPFGGNMGFKKAIFNEVGLFDIDLGRKGQSLNAGEEKELFRRIRSKSHDICYLPHAFLYHRVNAERLTVDYIKKQAYGLGQSMKLRLQQNSGASFIGNWFSEIGKMVASIPLAMAYLVRLQPAKATFLFKFRWWIWKGYFNSR